MTAAHPTNPAGSDRLPAADRLTRADRWTRSWHRAGGWLRCRVGRHEWAKHRNPEVSGALANFELCRRCRTERDVYGPPVPIFQYGGRR